MQVADQLKGNQYVQAAYHSDGAKNANKFIHNVADQYGVGNVVDLAQGAFKNYMNGPNKQGASQQRGKIVI